MKKENILNRGNDSLAIGAIFGVSAIAHPCPACILSSTAFFLNSIREKIKDD